MRDFRITVSDSVRYKDNAAWRQLKSFLAALSLMHEPRLYLKVRLPGDIWRAARKEGGITGLSIKPRLIFQGCRAGSDGLRLNAHVQLFAGLCRPYMYFIFFRAFLVQVYFAAVSFQRA